MKPFRPMLAPNTRPDLSQISYPILASFKMDGIRCIFKDGEMLSRTLRRIPNVVLQDQFEYQKSMSLADNTIYDGELYSPNLSFQEIVSCVMSKYKHKPESLKSYCFDTLSLAPRPFCRRIHLIEDIKTDNCVPVYQKACNNSQDIADYYDLALDSGYEGLILKDPNGLYKQGRCTMREGLMFKLKPIEKFMGTITDVIQATAASPSAPKTTNNLGFSQTSKKLDDRIPAPYAAAFLVRYHDHYLKVTIAATDIVKASIWRLRSYYIGKTLRYKGMLIGAKDVPRHPITIGSVSSIIELAKG